MNDMKPKSGIHYSFRLVPKPGVNRGMMKPVPVLVHDNTVFKIQENGIVIQGQFYSRELLEAVLIQVKFDDHKESINVVGKPASAAPVK